MHNFDECLKSFILNFHCRIKPGEEPSEGIVVGNSLNNWKPKLKEQKYFKCNNINVKNHKNGCILNIFYSTDIMQKLDFKTWKILFLKQITRFANAAKPTESWEEPSQLHTPFHSRSASRRQQEELLTAEDPSSPRTTSWRPRIALKGLPQVRCGSSSAITATRSRETASSSSALLRSLNILNTIPAIPRLTTTQSWGWPRPSPFRHQQPD